MQRAILLLLVILCLMGFVIIAQLMGIVDTRLLHWRKMQVVTLPTLAILPSLTPFHTPTTMATLTPPATITSTPPAALTTTSTKTPMPIPTQTLATRVISIRAVMPGVYVPPTVTPFPVGTILLPAPPNPVEPLPDATHEAPPYGGWYSFESDHPLVQYAPSRWEPRLHTGASRGQYHRTENASSYVIFPFEGEGLRIRYVAAKNMGQFEVIVDGELIDTVDARASDLSFPGTRVYFVGPGSHTLMLQGSGAGSVVGLDAIQVYRGTENTLIIPPLQESITPSPLPQPVAFERIAVPPTVQPTETTPDVVNASVVIAYDENGNGDIDPAEGVAGISVRLVEVGTNRAIAQSFTDVSGYTEVQMLTASPVRVVVPYFGAVWDVSRSPAHFTLLLDPGNQPGLIP